MLTICVHEKESKQVMKSFETKDRVNIGLPQKGQKQVADLQSNGFTPLIKKYGSTS